VREDLPDHRRVVQRRDQPQAASAVRALQAHGRRPARAAGSGPAEHIGQRPRRIRIDRSPTSSRTKACGRSRRA
jgi:hypothetical protein